jgi:5-methyltetrahydropteroyltriglutamate--homocysteine methyltransferase
LLDTADQILFAPSRSLVHCPLDVTPQTELDDDARQWLAFVQQKLSATARIAKDLNQPGHDPERLKQSKGNGCSSLFSKDPKPASPKRTGID